MTAAGVSSGTEQETSIDGAAYEEAAGRVRGPMDEPGGSFTFAHGARKVAPFSIAVFGFGVSFGVLAAPAMGRVAPIVMSVTTFAGRPSSPRSRSWATAGPSERPSSRRSC